LEKLPPYIHNIAVECSKKATTGILRRKHN
jgi:hypothetical protein